MSGPRIVVNPAVFRDKRDALCTAFNEAIRVICEKTGFEPQSEPTERQRKFFSDTAYADDELQLRRTILARIATFDTSVKDPTDDQLAETGAFLDAILESDWCKNEWERNAVSRLSEAVKAAVGAEPVEPRSEPLEPREPEPLQSRAAMDGGETEDENKVDTQTVAPEAAPDNTEPQEVQEVQETTEPGTPGQPEGQVQQDAPGATQEPGASPAPGGNPEGRGSGPSAAPAGPAEAGPGTPKQGDIRDPIVDPNSPGSIAYKGKRPGDIRDPIVDPNSPGSIAYKGKRPGDIRDPIVDPNSPGSIAYQGKRPGDIRDPIVDPNSPGSIAYKGKRQGAIASKDSPGSFFDFVRAGGAAFSGFDRASERAEATEEQKARSTSADAKLDDRERKKRKI